MWGLFKIMIVFAAFLVAGLGIYYLWTGELPAHTLKFAATYGLINLVILFVTFITRPAGEKH